MNFADNGECAQVTGDSVNFGQVSGNITQVNPATLEGWGVRQNDWQWGITVQQQVIPRMSVEVAYNRRWFKGNKVTDNTLRGPTDYDAFTLTAPLDPRLPDGGGYPINLQLVTQAASDRGTKNYVTFETDFGPEQTNYWHGVDFTLMTRLRQGLTMQLGTQTGRSVIDTCATDQNIDATTQTLIKDLRSCHNAFPFQTTVRGLASYTVPKVDVLISGTVRSQPPFERTANWTIPNSVILAAAGRLPPGAQLTGNTTVNVLDTDHRLFADNRRTQIDMETPQRSGTRAGVIRAGVYGPSLRGGPASSTVFNAAISFRISRACFSSSASSPIRIASLNPSSAFFRYTGSFVCRARLQ